MSSITKLYYDLPPLMGISARLPAKTLRALERYCKAHGLTKTEALGRGIALLLREERASAHHPAFEAFERLRPQLTVGRVSAPPESVRDLKCRLDEKYPG
jgi:hypothetical protein